MRHAKKMKAIWAVTGLLVWSDRAHADFTYDFDGLTGSPNPGTQLTPATSIGASGQDNWFLSAGPTTPPVVRNDPMTGFSGNYLTGVVTANGGASSDTVVSRAGANLGLGNPQYAVFQFDGLVGTGFLNSSSNPVFRRSWIGPGYDSNHDGDIRGQATTSENNEAGFLFGFESSSPSAGWFIRRAAFSNTGSVSASTTAAGVYTMQLVVDFNANPVTGGNDGAGTLYVKQLADANGNPVNDVFRVASATTTNVNLGITTGMTTTSNNPSLWNGIFARVGNNGGVDNISISAGTASLVPGWAGSGVGGAGDWQSATNWTYTGVPNAVDAVANFTAGANADATVYSDSAVTVGTMKFNNTHTYNIGGLGTLTLQVSTGSALVDVQSANVQKINLPLVVASNTTFNIASGGTLKISDPMTVNSGVNLNQTGAGSILYESNVTLQPTASMALGSNTSIHSLSLSGATGAWTSTVDVANHTMVLRTGDVTQMRDQLKGGYNAGAWTGNGIESSAAAANHAAGIGYASGASLLGLSGTATATFDGQTVDASSLIAKYTWSGDANIDGKVDTSDFMAVANNFNGSGELWQTGDFNYDGVVNALDFNAVATNFGQTSPPSAPSLGALVPEPATLATFSAAVAVISIRRRRRI